LNDAPDDYAEVEEEGVRDDRLRLIFTCCNPALAPEARIALTLREVCGLTTEEIARAYLTTPSTLAQRIVRAKSKIRDAGIPYEVPERQDLPERLETVLQVIYLVFNEGYSPSFGDDVTRPDLSSEAIRLARLLHRLLPEPEVAGLLALMLLHESRRTARTDSSGDVVLLEHQDRTQWNSRLIDEGTNLVGDLFARQEIGPYAIQAAISAIHAGSATWDATDWVEIVALYDLLLEFQPGPVVELNRAVAVGMIAGPETGLSLIEEIVAHPDMAKYHLAHSARAEFARRAGKAEQALASYRAALDLARLEPEKRFFSRRIHELSSELSKST
jgi:RNA polymerase sigma-70 factor (ECF subfamily)